MFWGLCMGNAFFQHATGVGVCGIANASTAWTLMLPCGNIFWVRTSLPKKMIECTEMFFFQRKLIQITRICHDSTLLSISRIVLGCGTTLGPPLSAPVKLDLQRLCNKKKTSSQKKRSRCNRYFLSCFPCIANLAWSSTEVLALPALVAVAH